MKLTDFEVLAELSKLLFLMEIRQVDVNDANISCMVITATYKVRTSFWDLNKAFEVDDTEGTIVALRELIAREREAILGEMNEAT